MAGFFGLFDYSKPGPGVDKDQPQKFRFFIFFEIYFRKFWKLILMNLLYLATLLPLIALAWFSIVALPGVLKYVGLILPIALMGPTTAGFTYVMRNFSREEHAFLWMDFKDAVKKNWKQALAVSVINSGVGVLLSFSVPFWFTQYTQGNPVNIVPFALCAGLGVVFLFMQYYMYTLIITFHLSLKQLYKNCFIFAFLGLFKNLLLTLLLGLLGVVMYLPAGIIPALFVLFAAFFPLSYAGFLINFVTWPTIKKYMVDPYYAKIAEESPETVETEQDNSVFRDRGRERKPKK